MRTVILFLILLSVTGFAISGEDCDEPITYPFYGDIDCDSLDLVVTGELHLETKPFLGSLKITSGKINATELDSLIVDGSAEYYSPTGTLTIENLQMNSGSFTPAEGSLIVTDLYYTDGSLDFGNDKSIGSADLLSPIAGAIIKQIENNYDSSFNLMFDGEKRLLFYDNEWEIGDLLTDSFLVTSEYSNVVVVNEQDFQDSLVGPIVTTPNYGQINKSSFELEYIIEGDALIEGCDLYLGGELRAEEPTYNKFSLTLTDATYSWKVSCLDVWGNSSESSSKEIIVLNDTETPTLVFETDPSKYEVLVDEEIEILCEAADNVKVSQIKIYDVDRTTCTGTEECSRKKSWSTEGEREFFCTALDLNGNNETASLIIYVADESDVPSTTSNDNNDDSNDNNNDDSDSNDNEKKEESSEVTGLVLGDDSNSLTFPVNGLSVREVTVIFENETDDVTVEQGKPTVEEPGIVYEYLEIETGVEIKEAKIKFTVPKSWIEENEINKEEIVLLHFKDGWKELSTTILEEKDEYIEFESTCYSFSLFAVGVKSGFDFSLAIIVVVIGALLVIGFVMFSRTKSRNTRGYAYRPHIKKF